jgi:hypothetical protein
MLDCLAFYQKKKNPAAQKIKHLATLIVIIAKIWKDRKAFIVFEVVNDSELISVMKINFFNGQKDH